MTSNLVLFDILLIGVIFMSGSFGYGICHFHNRKAIDKFTERLSE